jgi:hypothetical protein
MNEAQTPILADNTFPESRSARTLDAGPFVILEIFVKDWRKGWDSNPR